MIRLKLHISKTLLNPDLPPYLTKTLLPINLEKISNVKGSIEQLTIKDLMVCVYSQVTSMLKGKINRSKLYFTTIDDYFLPPTASLVSTIFTDVSIGQRDETRPIETEPILLLTTQVFDESIKVTQETVKVAVNDSVGKLKEKRQQKVTFKE